MRSYTWNFTTTQKYYNQTNLKFNLSNVQYIMQYRNITGLYSTNITFADNLSTMTDLYPTCVQNGVTYTTSPTLPLRLPLSTANINCTLWGYYNKIFNITKFVNSTKQYIQPSMLSLTFTSKNLVRISSLNQILGPFNISALYIPNRNISTGYVTVEFNYYNGKYQQLFKYYNDLNTVITDNLLIQTVNLVQTVQIFANSQPISGARVCALAANNNTWKTTFCDYTDNNGYVYISLADQTNYKFAVQKEGYESAYETVYIPPLNQNIVSINLVSSTGTNNENIITSTCQPTENNDKTCILNIVTARPVHAICINSSRYVLGVYTPGVTLNNCQYNSISATWIYSIFGGNTDNNTIKIYFDNDLMKTFNHVVITHTPSATINTNQGNQSGKSIIEAVNSNIETYIAVHLMMLLLAIFGGMTFEKMLNGKGKLGLCLTCGMIALVGFSLFWVPVAILTIHILTSKTLEWN